MMIKIIFYPGGDPCAPNGSTQFIEVDDTVRCEHVELSEASPHQALEGFEAGMHLVLTFSSNGADRTEVVPADGQWGVYLLNDKGATIEALLRTYPAPKEGNKREVHVGVGMPR